MCLLVLVHLTMQVQKCSCPPSYFGAFRTGGSYRPWRGEPPLPGGRGKFFYCLPSYFGASLVGNAPPAPSGGPTFLPKQESKAPGMGRGSIPGAERTEIRRQEVGFRSPPAQKGVFPRPPRRGFSGKKEQAGERVSCLAVWGRVLKLVGKAGLGLFVFPAAGGKVRHFHRRAALGNGPLA